ncbi:hypothetical protein ACROYT_G018413 [Oculina patagonica]
MVNSASIMKKKKAFIGKLFCFLTLCCICKVSGTTSYNSQKPSSDNSLDVLTSADFNNPSAQRLSADKTTDVDITLSFSPPKSAVRTKRSSKSSSVNNQEEASGFQNGRQLAPNMHEDFKPVKLRTNVWRGKHKFPMEKFIIRRAARKSNDWKPPGISQGDVDVSSLVRQAIKRGRDVAFEGAKKTAAHDPQETTTEDMKKIV